jgi:hypothetical protein
MEAESEPDPVRVYEGFAEALGLPLQAEYGALSVPKHTRYYRTDGVRLHTQAYWKVFVVAQLTVPL